ncbi:MAG: putative zinc-binding metallopeptidase [Phycisphaerae bacterium]
MRRRSPKKTRRGGAGRARRRRVPRLADLTDEKLLDLRLCDLDLKIEGTILEERIERVEEELQSRDLRIRPHYWLSSEWFVPDGVPGVGIPFFLAHPRLMQLEKRQMLEVEGETARSCMQILRHEVGHAVDNAFRLHRKRKWQQIFGKASQPYPDYYQPKPHSKRFVLNIENWYAQSHPAEDFAETFAVWLAPGSQWKKRYKGWPALKKLEYVDALMAELAGRAPLVTSREEVDPIRKLRITLRSHYEKKRARYGEDYPDVYDRDLRRLFAENTDCPKGELAARFLQRIRPEIRRLVARWTGEYQYTIDQVLGEMISRCRALKLRVDRPKKQAELEATILLAVQTMNYLHSGRHRLVL